MKNLILIIDDDIAVLEILEEWLTGDGYEVITVAGSNDVLALIKKYNPNLVILDYQLKGINGGELCLDIKRSSSHQHLPVIIFSAFNKSALKLENYHCDLFVQKPFDLYLLAKQISDLIYNPSLPISLPVSVKVT